MSRARGRDHATITLLVLAALIGCNRAPEQPAPSKGPAVTVVPVAQRRVPVYGQYVGQTAAVQTVDVRARVEGYLERQAVPDGATVKAGELLFVIDPRTLRIALDSARAQQARDEARLVNARQVAARYRPLYEGRAVSRQELEQAQADERAAAATVEASRTAVAQAELDLSYTEVRSPITGRLGRAEVRVGSLVGRGEPTLLVTVSTLDPMHVYWSVSEREALDIWRRRSVEMRRLPDPSAITITLPDNRVYAQTGRLDFVDRAVDPETGTLALRAAFPNGDGLLRPGLYVRLRVLLEERDAALVVPQAAVVESQGSATLFVVKPDQTVEARPVTMGPRVGPLWVVEDGVAAGEHVVVKGLQQIRPGGKVEPSVEAFPADAAGPAPAPPARPRPRT